MLYISDIRCLAFSATFIPQTAELPVETKQLPSAGHEATVTKSVLKTMKIRALGAD